MSNSFQFSWSKSATSFGSFAPKQPAAKASTHPGGVTGFLDNLAGDVESTVTGFVPGLIHTAMHPIQAGEAIGHDFATRYGPLVHGDFGKFFHDVGQHPLSYLLDAAAVATAGAGLGARAGLLSGKAGQLLLRTPGAIDEGLSLGKAAEEGKVATLPTSHNPLIRLRQRTIHAGLSKIPGPIGESIEGARYTNRAFKASVRNKARNQLAHFGLVDRMARVGGGLSENELIAHNLRGPMIPPDVYAPRLKYALQVEENVAKRDLSGLSGNELKEAQRRTADAKRNTQYLKEQLKLVERPEVNTLFHSPSPRMQEFRDLAKEAGDLDAHSRGVKPYVDDNGVFHDTREDRRWAPLERVLPGMSRDEIKDYLKQRGLDEPIYLPEADVEQMHGRGGKGPTGSTFNVPKDQVFRNKHLLFDLGRVAVNADTLTSQTARGLMHSYAIDLYHTAAQAGREVSADEVGRLQAKGWVHVRRPDEDTINYLTKQRGAFIKALEDAGDDEAKASEIFKNLIKGPEGTTHSGKYLMVPGKFIDKITGDFKSNNKYIKALWDKPGTIWKTILLGLRPAFAANMIVGNSFMYALHFAGVNGAKGLIHAVGHKPGGDAEVAKMLSHLGLGGAKEGKTFLDNYPEMVHGGFANTVVPFMRGKADQNLLKHIAKTASKGLFPLVAKLERRHRVAAMEAAARSAPEIMRELKGVERRIATHGLKLKKGETPLGLAMRIAFNKHPGLQDHIASQINNAMGNYHALMGWERSLQRLSPFYPFYKHVAKSAGDLLINHPSTTDVALTLGGEGHASNEEILGEVPPYLGSLVPIGGKAGGHIDGVLTTALNPYVTAVDLGKAGSSLVHGDATAAARDVGTFLHPVVTAGIEQATGKSLLTGSPVKGGLNHGHGGLLGSMAGSVVGNLPQVALAGELLNPADPNKVEYTPTGRLKKKKAPLYQHDWQQLLLSYLGVPYRNVNLTTAQGMGGG